MSPTKTPTSSLSATELLVQRAWYRCRTKIRKLLSADASPEAPAARSASPAAKLPLEMVEIIIAHLIYDTSSLLACSLTCYSWYIASVPHLHHTIITRKDWFDWKPSHEWPRLLHNASNLGLLPLVKKFQVCDITFLSSHTFSPKQFNRRSLRQFSMLTNIQELCIDALDIPKFIPSIQRYFGHLLPTLQSLTLSAPKGSRREIIFFIGLFQHLEDLTLRGGTLEPWESEPVDDLTLIPPFAPPLRGRLMMKSFAREDFLKDMIRLFGKIRFHYVDIYDVGETRILLRACAETLETLRLYRTDPHSNFPLLELDLSQNKSLRTLEVKAWMIILPNFACAPNPATSGFLRTALSTITSPVFSEVVILYQDVDFCYKEFYPISTGSLYRGVTPSRRALEASWHRRLFEVFREMYTVREFRLVLCAEVWDRAVDYAVDVLKRTVAAEKAAKRLDYLPSEPVVVYSRT